MTHGIYPPIHPQACGCAQPCRASMGQWRIAAGRSCRTRASGFRFGVHFLPMGRRSTGLGQWPPAAPVRVAAMPRTSRDYRDLIPQSLHETRPCAGLCFACRLARPRERVEHIARRKQIWQALHPADAVPEWERGEDEESGATCATLGRPATGRGNTQFAAEPLPSRAHPSPRSTAK